MFLTHVLKFLFVCLIVVVGLIYISSKIVERQTFKNNETEANLFLIKDHRHYDYLIMGISHARNLSRNTHHEVFENKFGGTAINLAQGDGLGGLENQYWYLSYFLQKHNTAKNLLMVLSPTMMYSNQIDKNSFAFYREPLQWDFIKYIIAEGGSNKFDQLFHYIKAKLGHHWWRTKPVKAVDNNTTLAGIDSLEMKNGFTLAYPQGLDDEVFLERTLMLDKILETAKIHQIRPIIIIPPALFGQWKGHKKILDYLKNNYPSIQVIDSSLSILQPQYYSDHHHLNTAGIRKWLDELVMQLKK